MMPRIKQETVDVNSPALTLQDIHVLAPEELSFCCAARKLPLKGNTNQMKDRLAAWLGIEEEVAWAMGWSSLPQGPALPPREAVNLTLAHGTQSPEAPTTDRGDWQRLQTFLDRYLPTLTD